MFEKTDYAGKIINFDKLTYAGNPYNLENIAVNNGDRYTFVKGDICDYEHVLETISSHDVDTIIHFAAESHVDRSIHGQSEFIETNIKGTFVMLDACRSIWKGRKDVLFHHVSTDEVFGSLGKEGFFVEETPYDPRGPYSANKAGSDHLVMAYFYTYGLPITMSNCSNNYGPYQFPEKLIPFMISRMENEGILPIYGKGENVRDWIYVDDHCEGIWMVILKGVRGEKYNFGSDNEWRNIDLVKELITVYSAQIGAPESRLLSKIEFVSDRPGHDMRYAIDSTKLKEKLGWTPRTSFKSGLQRTVAWYCDNGEWIKKITSGGYRLWEEKNYSVR